MARAEPGGVAKTLLVVEDDESIALGLEMNLTAEGYRVISAADGEQGLALARSSDVDLVILDVMLPRLNGFELLRTLRNERRNMPIIMLSARSAEMDKVMGLELGAEDYITKPFGAFELAARVRASLRRRSSGEKAGPPIKSGSLMLDGENRVARLSSQTLKLQPKEFDILYLLVSNAGRLLTRSFLIQNTSSYGAEVSTRSLDTHIKNIRKKLGGFAKHIETVPKMGYRFAGPS
jgi:DNA-binding response OmpR family regulator